MTLSILREGRASVLRIGAPRLVYASLSPFLERAGPCLEEERPLLVLDFKGVNYVDSAAIGCLMDLYRRASARKGAVAMCGLMDRVERMLRMTGAHEFISIHRSTGEALAALGAASGRPAAGEAAGGGR